jgi:putative DNA methylase
MQQEEQHAVLSLLERRHLPPAVSRLAEHEAWRKERHRPATYVHKWWARRLGTVFRAVLLEAASAHDGPRAATALAGRLVYDPFAGSGTTLVEAAKLGARVVGRDINPVATLTQRQALQRWDMDLLGEHFAAVERACRSDIDELYRTATGEPVLHYFWVAVTNCPQCSVEIELFSNYVFAKHAYPARQPLAHATCPTCHAVCPVTLGQDAAGHCAACNRGFSFTGPVKDRIMTCGAGHQSRVIDALGRQAPQRRMYAKRVITTTGAREYQAIDQYDEDLYERAAKQLADASSADVIAPVGTLEHGASTIQALRWGYNTWASFFNDRQLYCLGRIAAAIRGLPGSGPEREALAAAFGKTLEHNNVFCSYKGEGTGPVRSIFHNHVLRPERCSVEGSPWGSDGGSGGYAETLNRLRQVHAYKAAPRDLIEEDGAPVVVTGRSQPVDLTLVRNWAALCGAPRSAYVMTADAAVTDLPTGSVDFVITDPPYVDNVHYSELADFFHAWMRSIRPFPQYPRRASTRDKREVQNQSACYFEDMITSAWIECARVLKDDGLLAFSFHQSQTSGWAAVMASLQRAGFIVTATRPVVAEVTTSLTKHAAVAPNRIDVIVVCRKAAMVPPAPGPSAARACAATVRALVRLDSAGLMLGPADVRSAVRAAVLALATREVSPDWDAWRRTADEQAERAVTAGGTLSSAGSSGWSVRSRHAGSTS